jgi:hypothetical protein
MFGVDPTSLETVPVVTNSLAYELPLNINIADSKEEVIEQEAKDEAGTRIFSDGLCQNGSVGASAVLYMVQNGAIDEPAKILRCHLGPDTAYSIWDAEAAGAIMALWLLKKSNRLNQSLATLYSDSQAFIKSVSA